MEPMTLILGAVGLIVGGAICFFWLKFLQKGGLKKSEEIIREANETAARIAADAKSEALRVKTTSEKETQDERNELRQFERRLLKKEDLIDKRVDVVQTKEQQLEALARNLNKRQTDVESRENELKDVLEKEKQVLHNISELTKEQAVAMLLQKIEPELEKEKAELIRKRVDSARDTADEEARRIITMAIQRYAAEHTADTVVSVVDLPSDDMKGRIIGREGRNIRAFERATGVDIIVDDTPGVIVLSAFDGVRREMARRAIGKLIFDGRIHPSRIEELVEQTKKEMADHINQVGKQFLYEEGIHNVHPKLVTLLGRLKYRTSYGQNVLQHISEVAHLCSVMASEMKLDAQLARRCGIFHDIGKAVDQEMEGSHPQIGGELLKRFDETKEVADAAANHHSDANAEFPYTIIAAAADAISAARPGARGESREKYVKRLEKLESIATSFQGVDTAYAIQAGRELRIIANATKLDDHQALILARDVAKEVEKELVYPGEIKVTVIRETRIVEYAR